MHSGLKSLRFFHVIIILLLGSLTSRAEIDYGLVFRSYETTPAERTSLSIPGEEGAGIAFSDSLRISFSLKVNLNISRFGYICRTIVNKKDPIDILLYTPAQSPTYICATGDHENMIRIALEENAWQNLSLLLVRDRNEIKAALNGIPIAALHVQENEVRVNICFGQNRQGIFETTDVAPMVLKNLSIKADLKNTESWKLKGMEEMGKHGRLQTSLSNPIWFSELNSSWKKLWETELGSVSYIVPDNANDIVYFVSDRSVTAYDLVRMASSKWQTFHNMKLNLITNDFFVMPDGTLAYIDLDSGKRITFNKETHDWEEDNPRETHSVYLHGNSIFDKENDRFIHLFGYGYHRYLKDIAIWDTGAGDIDHIDIDGISPRYLSAVGMKDGKIYAYSGKGNVQGAQELGTRIYGDLICLDPDNRTCETIWSDNGNHDEVAAADLMFEDNRESFLALVYNPNIYKTSLQLKRFHTDGRCEAMAQPIPYNFLDIESEARLLYCHSTQSYYAVTVQKADDERFYASIYSILSPIQTPEREEEDGCAFPIWLILSAIALICGAAFAVWSAAGIRKKNGTHGMQEYAFGEIAVPDTNHAGIHLLDGFKVIAADGENITASFTPLMKQLLSIIILYSADGRGISNTTLKETLWMDKSDDSYNNNRGVTLKKIRTCLEKVDDSLNITSNNGRWIITGKKGLCDYLVAKKILGEDGADMRDILSVADMGLLLPDIRVEWIDSFKGQYEAEIIACLTKFRKDPHDEASASETIRICDAILRFDDIDESSIRSKCKALIIQKHIGTSKKVFDSFRENYQRTLDEEFSLSFNDFLNIKEN